MADFKSNEKA